MRIEENISVGDDQSREDAEIHTKYTVYCLTGVAVLQIPVKVTKRFQEFQD